MVGVCIKYFHENYGGMLQAYATVSMLEERGLEYELIQYKKKHTLISTIKAIPRLLNGVLLNDKYEAFLKKRGAKKSLDFKEKDAIRIEAFKKFREIHFTKLSPVFYGYDELCEGALRYTAVISGSDQLWSPAGLPTNFYNLMFVPTHIRKISVASSFGVKDIPWYQKRRTADFLRRLDHVSMREIRGAEIVEELTGRTVPTILDPVFLFDEAGWEQLVPRKNEMGGKYLFAYFLGDNPEYRHVVTRAAKDLGCKLVVLRHMDQYVESDESFGDDAPYDVGPDCFLNLIRGSAYICTDSFHGACFSIIHGKQFVVFDRYAGNFRYSKNSRIDTLCKNLGLQKRRFASNIPLAGQLTDKIDYSEIFVRLAKWKKETDCYLDEAFAGIR